MAQLNIAELSSALLNAQAKWRPIDNALSRLPDQERRQLLGVTVPPGFQFPQSAQAAAAGGPPPGFAPSVDWRNRNGNHVSPVKQQGGCGSCVSFCTVSVTESMASIEKGQLPNLSEADQHFCSSHGANCNGWWPEDSFNQIKARGVCDEACAPYDAAFSGNDIWHGTPSCKLCADRNARVTKITDLHSLTSTVDQKNYLTSTGPMAAIIEVYDDFFSYHTGIYHHISGGLAGLHCVSVIGYDEAGQYWICKNSWDTTWGESGFFRIAYGQCKIDSYPKIGVTGVTLPVIHGWSGWENLAGIITSRPNAVSWAANRIDTVARGTDSAVWHKWWNGSSWQGWESLGGAIQGAPAICSWGNGRLDIFARGLNNNLMHKWYQGGWSNWENLGGLISTEPACVSWGPNRIDIFARGMNNAMWHLWWDGAWHGWEDLGGVLSSAPAVSSWAPNRLDCFVRGTDSKLWHKWWNGSSWSNWENLGSVMNGAPAAESWGPNRIDVFYQGQTFHMMHKWWDGAHWSGEEDLGGILTSDVGVSSWASGRLDCFVKGTDSAMWHRWYS